MLWNVDIVKERKLLTAEEELCKQIFEKSVTKGSDGHYVVAMPFVPNHPQLAKYIEDLQQFIDLDHMELVPFGEVNKPDSEAYYIPHHAARTNKFRVVLDGSVKTSSGVSLNDILLNGPRVQEDLTSIVMRFRTHRVALTTDITKMYRQVRVPKEQRDFLRIVWRENENEPLKHYRLKTQTYGLKSSAYCCIETLRHCAREHANEFPMASKAVLESFYADDGTLGADNDTEAEELYRQLNAMLGKCGFPLAKWASNSNHMRSVIGATSKTIDLELFNENSVLGIKWSVQEDYFRYEFCDEIQDHPPTKRFFIASIAKLYDPNGWISPVIILGKMLIRKIWLSKCDWDTIVPVDLQSEWNEFRRALKDLSKVTIPRWLGISKEAIAEIQELTKGIQWKHVRTKDNPADLASRGLIATNIVNNAFWFNGPEWLVKEKDEWPVSAFIVDRQVEEATVEEAKPVSVLMTITQVDVVPRIEVEVKGRPTESLLDRCGSMKKLRQFFAKEINIDTQPNENCEVKTKHLNVGRDSSIVKLTPFVDGDGIMRVGGRIKRSLMPFDTVHPIILHHTCRFTHLLALEAHMETSHGGNQLCMQYIRQRFWIVNVRKAIKRVTLKCVPCFRQRKETAT
ncbi:uncharacterized protein LOC129572616 [Sitodiplosis mosellana]|uniref:uncharacterized protein LOC129572616 n=1 Tax=Sitodiplosis mosellana TaxID=263140 RepID=UPI002443AD16|nr:uncharacterized protein LOC129572616 [Sitodiplosis mosellana]